MGGLKTQIKKNRVAKWAFSTEFYYHTSSKRQSIYQRLWLSHERTYSYKRPKNQGEWEFEEDRNANAKS